MNSPRVCYLVPGFCADEADWCIPVLRNFIEGMARQVEAVVYTPHYPYRRGSYRACGATVHCLSNRKEQGLRRIMLWRELLGRIAEDHARAPFSLIHAFWATETGFLATASAGRLGIPALVSIGGGELARQPLQNYGSQLSAIQRFFVRRSFARASAITAGSHWVARRVPQQVRGKLHVVPLGVDTAMFSPATERRREGGAQRLVAAMSMMALKDYPTLLRAVALARRHMPHLTLTLAGDGPERPALERMAGELGLADIVSFPGNLPHDAMPELYRRSDLLLHTSLYESQGMVILEGLATGLPVISSNVGVAAELPDHLVYRFEPGDPEGMAAAILRSLAGDEHARAAFAEGPPLVRARYSVEGENAIFARLYRDLVMQL